MVMVTARSQMTKKKQTKKNKEIFDCFDEVRLLKKFKWKPFADRQNSNTFFNAQKSKEVKVAVFQPQWLLMISI